MISRVYIASFIICLSVLHLQARQLHVGKGMEWISVQKAISAATDGDTLFIHKGSYKEGNIILDKSLTVLGIDWPVLDGEMKHEIFSIKASHVTISGLKIVRSGHASMDDPCGIKSYDADHVVIAGNILEDNFFGIYIQYGSHCVVKNNIIKASGTEEQMIGNGIHCWKSDSLQIIGNRISGHRDGIYFEFVTHSVIWRNIATDNIRYGLHFMFSHNDSYFTNVFRNNGAGVAVMYTRNVTMSNNTFEQNWGDAAYGMLLKDISDSYISGNRFVNNTSGIHMEGSSRLVLEKNLFSENGWGLKIQASCMDITFRYNNFTANTFDVSTNGSLVLNTFQQNYWDKYEGYDLDKDHIGDVPYRPLSLFSVIAEKNPPVMLLFRSFIINLLDRSEKILPSLTPEDFIDTQPLMKAFPL